MSILNRGHARHGVVIPKIAPISGRYYGYRNSYGGTATTASIAADTFYAIPFFVSANITADRLGVNVSATGTATLMRLGIYSATAAGLPDARLVDSGALDPSGTGIKEATISQALTAGTLYFLALVANGTLTATATTAILSSFGNTDPSQAVVNALSRAFTYAALPAAWGTPTSYIAGTPNIAVRVV